MLSFSGMKRFHGGKSYFSRVKMGGKKKSTLAEQPLKCLPCNHHMIVQRNWLLYNLPPTPPACTFKVKRKHHPEGSSPVYISNEGSNLTFTEQILDKKAPVTHQIHVCFLLLSGSQGKMSET